MDHEQPRQNAIRLVRSLCGPDVPLDPMSLRVATVRRARRCPRFALTNLGAATQRLCDRLCRARGDMENRIKEPQPDLFADHADSHKYRANQFRLRRCAAYPDPQLPLLVAARLKPG